jgi:hypothetical protein
VCGDGRADGEGCCDNDPPDGSCRGNRDRSAEDVGTFGEWLGEVGRPGPNNRGVGVENQGTEVVSTPRAIGYGSAPFAIDPQKE